MGKVAWTWYQILGGVEDGVFEVPGHGHGKRYLGKWLEEVEVVDDKRVIWSGIDDGGWVEEWIRRKNQMIGTEEGLVGVAEEGQMGRGVALRVGRLLGRRAGRWLAGHGEAAVLPHEAHQPVQVEGVAVLAGHPPAEVVVEVAVEPEEQVELAVVAEVVSLAGRAQEVRWRRRPQGRRQGLPRRRRLLPLPVEVRLLLQPQDPGPEVAEGQRELLRLVEPLDHQNTQEDGQERPVHVM